MKPVEFHPDAESELDEAVAFYDAKSLRIGSEFDGTIAAAVEYLRKNPEAGPPVRGLLRRWLVRRFPYSIIYREEPGRLYILAIAHHRQKPDHWLKRV